MLKNDSHTENNLFFKKYNRPLSLIKKIKDGFIDLEKSKENQENKMKSKWNSKRKMAA